MKIYITDNPLNKNDDKTPIYTEHNYIPKPTPWVEAFALKKSKTTDFITNLYFQTVETNGFSYFYPEINQQINRIRFEWHYDFRDVKYFLRVGFCFKVKDLELYDLEYYIQRHDQYKDIKTPLEQFEIAKEEHLKIISFIQANIDEAIRRINDKPDKQFDTIHYIKLQRFVKHITTINNELRVLPSQIIGNDIVSAVIIPQSGFSYSSCQRFVDEKANILCAIWSLSIDHVKLKHIKAAPIMIDDARISNEILLKKLDQFYPKGKPIGDSRPKEVNSDDLDTVDWIYDGLNSLQDQKSKRKFINVLFSFYSGIDAKTINRTLTLVSLVACVDSITKELFPEFHDANGSRKAIVHCLTETLKGKYNEKDIDAWTKRVYNEHRSSYVHGASIKYEEFSQNMDGNNFAGLPNSLPTQNSPVGNQYKYENDLETLMLVSKMLLFRFLENLSGKLFFKPDLFDNIDFKLKSEPEVYMGLINNGWIRAFNPPKD